MSNPGYTTFITTGRQLAADRGLLWDIPILRDGSVEKGHVWDLSALVAAPPPRTILGTFAPDRKTTELLNAKASRKNLIKADRPLPPEWCELIKAVALNCVIVGKQRPSSMMINVLRPLRIIATCCKDTPPWEITGDDVQRSRDIASGLGSSGKFAQNIDTVVREIFDKLHLANRCPLLPAISKRRAPTPETSNGQHYDSFGRGTGRLNKDVRNKLEDRKSAEKLPDKRAFWELVRIVFTEEPKSLSDAIRFEQLKVHLLAGLRLVETCSIPQNWRIQVDHIDHRGRAAGEFGGISHTLLLRHYAAKQEEADDGDARMLYEASQAVPDTFEDLFEEAFERTIKLTAPIRSRLKAQTETNRLFPEFAEGQMLSPIELYRRLTGGLQAYRSDIPDDLVRRYRETYDPALLEEIWRQHQYHIETGPSPHFSTFCSKILAKIPDVEKFRNRRYPWNKNISWTEVTFTVESVEKFLREHSPTKLPDIDSLRLENGNLIYPHERMFLFPKRAVIEERDGGICDTTHYWSGGWNGTADLLTHLGAKDNTIFRRYGKTDEDRALTLSSHSTRHLKTTEMMRLAIADTVISKHFNRRSVLQNAAYDHRSLAEELDFIDVPAAAEELLDEKSMTVYKLIKAGKVTGQVVDEFKAIQREYGEEAAFAYLAAEADGFHTTPYGYCITSFLVESCPKHLECFGGCCHFQNSDQEKHRRNLERVRDQLIKAIEIIEAKPSDSIGRANQLEHAQKRLKYIKIALAAGPGVRPFPDGPDLSDTGEGRTVLDGWE
ncbi:MAG TPA: hypothetical protein VM659_20135 [Dongiaceae bacterium]|nr:hypothetical protein [Dongiaceae bacterium]